MVLLEHVHRLLDVLQGLVKLHDLLVHLIHKTQLTSVRFFVGQAPPCQEIQPLVGGVSPLEIVSVQQRINRTIRDGLADVARNRKWNFPIFEPKSKNEHAKVLKQICKLLLVAVQSPVSARNRIASLGVDRLREPVLAQVDGPLPDQETQTDRKQHVIVDFS